MSETTVDWDSAAEQAEFTGNTMPRSGTRTGGARRGRRVSDKRLAELQTKLSSEMFQAGAMIGMGVPVTGYYICQESDNFTNAVVSLAAKKSEWIAALENIAMLGPGIAIGRTVLGMGAALAADRYYRTSGEKGLNPDKQIAAFLGVTSAYYSVHPPEGYGHGTGNGFEPPPHGSFVPVS